MANEATQVLANFAASLKYENLPEHVRESCKNLLLDALACAVAGGHGEETEQVAALAGALAQSHESSVIGGDRLSLAGATMLNGFLITAVTMCDTHRATLTHVTPEVMPPALAIAERDGAVRPRSAGRARRRHGDDDADRHRHRLSGVPRARAGTARACSGRSAPRPRSAGCAASTPRPWRRRSASPAARPAGTFAAWGTPTVKFHQCRGALSGLMAALLAEQKFLATKEFLTAKDGGLFNTYANGGKPEAVTADLGQRWEFEQIALRLWPSASSTQTMNTALFDLVEQHAPDFDKIKKVRVSLSQTVFDLHGKLANYKAKFDALISAHYVAAAILHDRALTLAQFEPARYDDPKLRRAAVELIEVRPDPAIKGNNCAVEIEMADGTKLTSFCEHPRGSFENPLSRAQIESKFRTYAKGVIADAACRGGDRGGQPAGGPWLGAQADGPAARHKAKGAGGVALLARRL